MPESKADESSGATASALAVTELEEHRKRRVINALVLNQFQAVFQHVIAIQSEIHVFTSAAGGDEPTIMRALSLSSAMTGVLGLIVNQAGGQFSDTVGRKPIFMIGTIATMLSSLTIVKFSKNLRLLMAMRVCKGCAITLAGTIMTNSAVADVASGKEVALANARIASAVGLAVVLGPFLESLVVRLGNGDPRMAYKTMFCLSTAQLIFMSVAIPETLPEHRRVRKGLLEVLTSINPLGFVNIFIGKCAKLKKLLTIQTLQLCNDGKVSSDLAQLWMRGDLGMSDEGIRNFIAVWGATVVVSSALVVPRLLKRCSTMAFTSLGNLAFASGILTHSIPTVIGMFGGAPLLVFGINGGSSHAIKAIATDVAKQEGFNMGQWSAWSNNARVLAQSIVTVLLGFWYSTCKKRGVFVGSTWWFYASIAGFLPQILLMCMPRADLVLPNKKDEKSS